MQPREHDRPGGDGDLRNREYSTQALRLSGGETLFQATSSEDNWEDAWVTARSEYVVSIDEML